MTPNKQTYIDFIMDELNRGNVQYKDVMLAFVSKFKLTEQTFVRYWKTANEAYQEQRETINRQKMDESIANEMEAVKSLVLDKYDRLKIAEDIAQGKAKKIEGTLIVPSPSDRLRALDYLSRVHGDYAPTKVAATDSEGKDKEQISIVAPVGVRLEFPNNTDGQADT